MKPLRIEVTVSRVFEHTEITRGWKDPESQTTLFDSEKRGWHVAIAELGVAIPVGGEKPAVNAGDKLVLTLEPYKS